MPQAIPVVAALATTYVGGLAAAGTISTLGAAALTVAISAAAAFAQQAFTKRPNRTAEQQSSRIPQVESNPPYRYVYGYCQVGGQRWFADVVGDVLYLVYVFNSRPSHGEFEFEFDSRPLTVAADAENDLYDLSKGAAATSDAFDDDGLVRFYVGLGDHEGPPPDFVSEIPGDRFLDTDRFLGLTVLFVRLDYGSQGEARSRWLAVPPDIRITGKWSKVWDMRDPAQDADDPATWTFSDNQALCCLDMARDAQGWSRPLSLIDLDSFEAGADICDEDVPLKEGGSEKRYRVSGVVAIESPESDVMSALEEAGASQVMRTAGRLRYIPGAYHEPVMTLDDCVGDSIEYSDLAPSQDIANGVEVRFVSPERGWAATALEVIYDDEAVAEDGGFERVLPLDLEMIASHTQAQRVGRIGLRRLRMQRRFSGTFPLRAFNLEAGDVARLALPVFARADGVYEVAKEGLRAEDVEGGVALTVPLSLGEISPWVFDWTPETDERDFAPSADFSNAVASLDAPAALTATSGASVARGDGDGAYVSRVLIEGTPVASARVTGYPLWLREGEEDFHQVQEIPADQLDGEGNVFAYVEALTVGGVYDFRLFARAGEEVSEGYAEVLDHTVAPPSAEAPVAPVVVSAVSTTGGEAEITVLAPTDALVRALVVYGETDSVTEEVGTFPVGAGVQITVTETGLEDNSERSYTAKTQGPYGVLSEASDAVAVTIAPAFGPEMITDPDLAAATGWTVTGAGSRLWTHNAGTGAWDAGAGSGYILNHAFSLAEGTEYRLETAAGNRTAGYVTVQLSGGSAVTGTAINADGTLVQTITADSGNNNLRFVASSTFDGSLTFVSLKEVL